MHSFTQADVSRKCKVSRATVNRWVDLAITGKNALQLDLSDNSVRILDNPHNEAELIRLSLAASKYKNNTPAKKISLSTPFYNLFSEEELTEFYTDLRFNSSINSKYYYKNVGAQYWHNLYISGVSSIVKAVDKMLDLAIDSIPHYLPEAEKLNIIDIGPGDGYPVKKLITKLFKENKISKYISVDISAEINKITTENLQTWFPKLYIKQYQRDLEYGKIGSIFLENREKSENNIILNIGNTISNYEGRVQILKHLRSGMIPGDLLVITFTLDKMENRTVLSSVKNENSDLLQSWILDLIGIGTKLCQIIIEYNAELNSKTKGFKLDKDYEIEFKFSNRTEIVKLKAGQLINTWKHFLIDVVPFIEELRAAKLEIIDFKTDVGDFNALAICKIR